MKKIVSCVFLTLLLMACNDSMGDSVENISLQYSENSNLELKKKFAQALALSFAENPEIRNIVRNEALRKIDYDYDVLYLLIKDKTISSGGETIANVLSKYMSADDLEAIESQIPTLTIFVPTLPGNIFSAELWNTKNQAPSVGIRELGMNDVIMYDSLGKNGIIKSTPQFPIVVVKENERIVSERIDSNSSTRISNRTNLAFVDDVYNNIGLYTRSDNDNRRPNSDRRDTISNPSGSTRPASSTGDGKRLSTNDSIPDELLKACKAYDIYENRDGWQRDYVYYNITPDNVNGKYDEDYGECLVGFEMIGDPLTALRKISDQTGDPQETTDIHELPTWTDGEFEFMLKIYLGNKSGFGSELTKYFRISADKLFFFGGNAVGLDLKQMKNERANVSLPLFEWNLENYSSSVKIAVEEIDGTETIKTTSTTSTEFATNFGVDASIGISEKVKLGMEFGVTDKQVMSTSYEVTTTKDNDALGEVVVNFSDKIFTDKGGVSWLRGVREEDFPKYSGSVN